MTPSPSEYGRRLSRVEHDVTAMYEMLGDIQTVQGRHSTEFARLRTKLLEHDARFDAMDGRLDAMDGRFDAMDARFDAMDGRFDAMDARFDAVDGRFEAMDGTLREILRRLPDAS